MTGWEKFVGASVILICGACGGGQEKQPMAPPPPPEPEIEEPDLSEPEPTAAAEPEPEPEPEETKSEAPKEPVFTEGMSVQEAMNAVPREWDFVGLDGETLGKPLQQAETYQACKLKPSQHFKVRVAVWDGRAVGVDVDSKNKQLAECVADQIRQLEWKDKVKSLNTVEYAY